VNLRFFGYSCSSDPFHFESYAMLVIPGTSTPIDDTYRGLATKEIFNPVLRLIF
jgi:hypothetical protein